MTTQMSDDNYCVIFGWMCNGLKLNSNELLVYAVVYGFSQDGESRFYGGRGFLARTLNISKPTVDKALSSLCEKGFIHRIETERNGVKFHEYFADLQVVKNLYHPSEEVVDNKESLPNSNISLPSSKNIYPNSKESLPNNKVIPNIKESNSKENKDISFEKLLKASPEIANDPELIQAFLDFVKMRKDIKKPIKTPRGLWAKVDRCYKLAKGDHSLMIKILNRSIDKEWQDVYPYEDEEVPKKAVVTSGNPFADMYEQEGYG